MHIPAHTLCCRGLPALSPELTPSVLQDPTAVGPRLALIDALRKRGNLDKVKEARDALRQRLVMPECAWAQWVQDEWELADDVQEKAAVLNLLEAALQVRPAPNR